MTDFRDFAAIRALLEQGRKQEARRLVIEIIQQTPNDALAWAIMAHLVDDPRQVAACLRRIMSITDDPSLVEPVRARLRLLIDPPPEPDKPPPAAPSYIAPLVEFPEMPVFERVVDELPAEAPEVAKPEPDVIGAAPAWEVPPTPDDDDWIHDAAGVDLIGMVEEDSYEAEPPSPPVHDPYDDEPITPVVRPLEPTPESDGNWSIEPQAAHPGPDPYLLRTGYARPDPAAPPAPESYADADELIPAGMFRLMARPAPAAAKRRRPSASVRRPRAPRRQRPRLTYVALGVAAALVLIGAMASLGLTRLPLKAFGLYGTDEPDIAALTRASQPAGMAAAVETPTPASEPAAAPIEMPAAAVEADPAPALAPTPIPAAALLPPSLLEYTLIPFTLLDGSLPQDYGTSFGASVAIGGNTLVVGAPLEQGAPNGGSANTEGAPSGYGSVHVYSRANAAAPWQRVAILSPSDRSLNEDDGLTYFGSRVAVSGTGSVIAVTSLTDLTRGDRSSAVYIYERRGEQWVEVQKIISPDGSPRFGFGEKVRFYGNVLYISARGGEFTIASDSADYPGAVFVMERAGSQWVLRETLEAPSHTANGFGWDFDIDGDTLVVGAPLERGAPLEQGVEGATGAAYIFKLIDGHWTQTAVLREPRTDSPRRFGLSVAVEGAQIAVGSISALTLDEISWEDPGVVWMFEQSAPDADWEVTPIREPDDTPHAVGFGIPLELQNGMLLVGARGYAPALDQPATGAVFVFAKGADAWEQVTLLVPSNPLSALFGVSLAVEGQAIAVGAPGDASGETPEGVYLYDLPMLSPAALTSGQLDVTFGEAGLQHISAGNFNPTHSEIEVLADGKLLIAASDDSPGSTHDLMILRLNANGTLDETFVSGGMTRIPIPYQQPAIADIVVAADGGFTVLAYDAGQPPTITALRFLTDGTLDPTFGEGAGRARLDGEMDFVSAGGVQSDGKLVILGALGDDLQLIRLTPEGVYDTSFGDEGDVVTSLTMQGMNRGTLTVLPDDTLLVLGNQALDGVENYRLTRYKSKGILDVSFGNAGATALPDNLLDPTFTVLPDGKIVAGGILDGDFMMIRYESHGRQDRSFGVQGYVTLDLPEDIHIEAMVAQPDGKIIAVGSLGGGERSSLSVFRFNANGSFDPTFRAEAVEWPFAGESPVTALGIAPDGGVVIGGVLGEGDRREVYAARFEGR